MRTHYFYGLLMAFLMAFSLNIKAQPDADTTEYQRSYNNILQAGFSFGYYGYGYVGSRVGFTLPVSASYETYFGEHFSGGGFLGYASYKYEDINSFEYGWRFIDFGVRASYHYLHFFNKVTRAGLDQNKFDFYVSLMLIFEARNYYSDDTFYANYYDNDFNVALGPVAGFRYKFSDKFATFFEGGRGTFGYGTIGISYMF